MNERGKLLVDLVNKERILSEFMASILHIMLELSAKYAKEAPKLLDDVIEVMKELEKCPETTEEQTKNESN